MAKALKPENVSWITTYLTVEDPEKALKFYTEIFEFTQQYLVRSKTSDRILYCRLQYKDCCIAFGPTAAFAGRTGGVSPIVSDSISPVILYVYVDNLDALFEKCKNHPLVQIVKPIESHFWGERLFKCQDPEGYHWDFVTQEKEPQPRDDIVIFQ